MHESAGRSMLIARAHDRDRSYIAEDDPSAASRLINRIESTVLVLKQHSEAGRVGRVHGTRELVITGSPFVVPYRVRGNAIEILAVIHGARNGPIAPESRAAWNGNPAKIGVYGSSSGGHVAELLAMRPRDSRYNAIPLQEAPKADASVACVAMRSPISNAFARY